MTHVELSAHEIRLHGFREIAQAQQIADGAAERPTAFAAASWVRPNSAIRR